MYVLDAWVLVGRLFLGPLVSHIGGDPTVGSRGRRLLSGVSYSMLLQIAPVVECGVTFFAGIRFYSCVGLLV